MTNKEKTTGVPIEDDAQCSPEEMRKLINQVAGEIAYLNYINPYRREYDRERER